MEMLLKKRVRYRVYRYFSRILFFLFFWPSTLRNWSPKSSCIMVCWSWNFASKVQLHLETGEPQFYFDSKSNLPTSSNIFQHFPRKCSPVSSSNSSTRRPKAPWVDFHQLQALGGDDDEEKKKEDRKQNCGHGLVPTGSWFLGLAAFWSFAASRSGFGRFACGPLNTLNLSMWRHFRTHGIRKLCAIVVKSTWF
jgi:hypothetical protein